MTKEPIAYVEQGILESDDIVVKHMKYPSMPWIYTPIYTIEMLQQWLKACNQTDDWYNMSQ